MIRLFVAIDIPENIRQEVQGMGRSIPTGRPVPENQLHITLKFIGEVDGTTFLDILDVLGKINQPKFSLCLKGVGVFPPRGIPRILWAGVPPVQNLVALRKSIERELAEINIPREKKKFSPHLTLARLNNPPITKLQQFLAGNALLKTSDFPVQTFNLYSSQLTPKGAIHTLQNTYPLR
ncbi:RNA 2',3'-cyclic phosphodiesterase [Desulforhopalus sp. IMCC35007]|uniref:RNA 2',3'-cyclic phosphodiesterase n=1 Tax=Desulforhopalus sp. IMCC35007 TaxID=2569543 RepID=UPI0010AE5738|nr:RNA 2',3'-cyclic phosphodiesterase [Desulforhopalus sp. IMCC35007]TKB05769.1 RNA 2',3'-cyclic phosphodiesterase [Desulforhopalus sp. IMCC35007]